MSNYQKYFIVVILLTIAAGLICWFRPLVKGLDIDGGMRVVMQVDPQRKSDWPSSPSEQLEKMKVIKKTITTRVQGIQGVAEPIVAIQGTNRIVIELPGVKDTESALKRIKNTASLEFYYLKDVITQNNPTAEWDMKADMGDEKGYTFVNSQGETINSLTQPKELLEKVVKFDVNSPLLTGKDLLPVATANINQSNQKVIGIEFNQAGTEIFREFTRKHVGDILAVFFDGKLLTAPSINEAIPSGKAEVSGFKSLQQARQTAEYLNSGALPIPMKVMTRDTVEPTLGKETVNQVVMAGILGILLVILFMAIYYKLPGIIACIALCLYTLYTVAAFKLLGATMSLAGVAALIISIGMAVDANILIFERLKEELRNGKTLRAAIDAGFSRAFTAIFDSNMCTAITCVILMWLGSPAVKSFATTLLVGVIISMFTAITVTRTILHMLVNMEWAQKPSLYGLARSWTAGTHAKWDIVGKKNYYFILSAVLIVPGLIILGMYGLKPGIEFKSGTSIQATFTKPVTLLEVKDIVKETSKENEVQLSKVDGETKVAFIKTLPLSEDKEDALLQELNSKIGIATVNEAKQPRFDSVSKVEPTISNELTQKAILAVMFASIAIILYLTGRFAIGSLMDGLKFGVCAVIALIHDAAFIIGLFAILGHYFQWEVDSLFVTAVLTIIGFSVHDTIVVFDRIRENMRHKLRGESFEQLCNRSILQTLSRSINTSFTVVMTLVALVVLGGPLLRHFYVAMLVGIIIGTYSSIFNATQLVIVWEGLANKEKTQPKKKAFEDKPMVDVTTLGVAESQVGSIAGALLEEAMDEEDNAQKSASTKSDRIKRKTKKKRF